ncbi:carbohydrate kinase family protein [Candidatus Saccharibacteria bacterium]|nr:carbohydrate kinase family protein [Candidatus Saccharibacteria bacterium]
MARSAVVPRIVSIGAAVQDVFLLGKIFRPEREDDGLKAEFNLGSKNEVEEVVFSTGGGATNASVTFARQGLHSMYMGRIGRDIAGRAVLDALHADEVDTTLVLESKQYNTGYSVLMLAPNGERTILTYRGASNHYDLKDSHFHGIEADWFYVSSLSGDFDALKRIISYAKTHGIRVAVNPGKGELAHRKEFLELMKSCHILSVNKEEMQQLIPENDTKKLLQKATRIVPLVLVTDGPKGSIACDGQSIYRAGLYKDVKVIDRSGAGDAFTSGFVAKIASGGSIEAAMTFASANSTSVVTQLGAKPGILRLHATIDPMKVAVAQL